MNKDQSKGRSKEVGGKIQEKFGKLTGSEKHRAEGASKEAEGRVQKSYGDAKHDVGKTIDR